MTALRLVRGLLWSPPTDPAAAELMMPAPWSCFVGGLLRTPYAGRSHAHNKRLSSSCIEGLSAEQRAAVLETAPKVLVLAGAGSGKTRVLVARLAQLIALGASPERLLAFSFTRKACAEIRMRLEALCGAAGLSVCLPPIAFTFNAFAFQVVRAHHRLLGFSRPPRVLTDGDDLPLVRAFEYFLADCPQRPSGSPAEILSRLRPGPRALVDPTLTGVERAFRQWKRTHGLVELSDQVSLALEVLNGPVGESVRSRYDAVLVDEFQDIDPEQERMFERLVWRDTPFMLFGDDDQAIYRWRGAEPTLIRAYHRAPGVVTHLLTTNYRCRAPILALAAAIVAGDPGRIAKPATAFLREGLRPRMLIGKDQPARLARAVQRLSVAGRALEDIAVLVRDHADARDVQRALERASLKSTRELDGEGVRVLTFHGSKGLEFPVVFIPFLDRGRFPGTRRLEREHRALLRRRKEAASAARLVRGAGPLWRHLLGWFRPLRRLVSCRWLTVWSRGREERHAERLRRAEVLARWAPALEAALRDLPAEQEACLAEERRLCYVAMTRAREELWLFCKQRTKQSEFMDGTPAKLVVWEEDDAS